MPACASTTALIRGNVATVLPISRVIIKKRGSAVFSRTVASGRIAQVISSPFATAGSKLSAGLVATTAVLAVCGFTSSGVASAKSLIPAKDCDRNSAAGTINFVSPYSYDASAGIMDVFMAQKLGYFRDLCLKISINAASFTGEELVSANRAQVTGIGTAADALLTAATGANITAVATYGQTDPSAIYTNRSVTSLKGLEGGTLGYYTNITPAALQMLANAGVDISKVNFIKMTSYDPTVVTRGTVDGLIGYRSNQGSALAASGQPYNSFYPSHYGVHGTYNVMQFNRTWLSQHTAAAADFMRADLKALEYCLVHRSACADYMAAQAAANHQGASFPKSLTNTIWRIESRFITSSPKPWGAEGVAEWRYSLGLVKRWGHRAGMTSTETVPPLTSKIENTTLVRSLYMGNKLIWPGT